MANPLRHGPDPPYTVMHGRAFITKAKPPGWSTGMAKYSSTIVRLRTILFSVQRETGRTLPAELQIQQKIRLKRGRYEKSISDSLTPGRSSFRGRI